jgi:hypothetical protein
MNNLGLVSRLEPIRPVVNGTGAYLVSFHVLRISEIFCNFFFRVIDSVNSSDSNFISFRFFRNLNIPLKYKRRACSMRQIYLKNVYRKKNSVTDIIFHRENFTKKVKKKEEKKRKKKFVFS